MSDDTTPKKKPYPRFSDFNPRPVGLEGEKKRMGEILGTEILIRDFRMIKGKYNTACCVQIQFELDSAEGKKFIVFSGSSVLQEQLETSKDRIPFYTTIQRIDRYLTFS